MFVTLDSLDYEHIGCYKDNSSRVIKKIDGDCGHVGPSLKGRVEAIEKCYQCAKDKGFTIFALQNGGECRADEDGAYDKYGGPTGGCINGTGGGHRNDVYRIEGKVMFIISLDL